MGERRYTPINCSRCGRFVGADGDPDAGAPELTITLTHDDCNVLMHGLMPVDQILYTGDGETIPPFEDTPEMREFREHYVDLLERIIDVGVGRGDYDA